MTKLLIALIAFSCLIQTEASAKRKKRKKHLTQITTPASDIKSNTLVVSFISVASGIDRPSTLILENEIKQYQGSHTTCGLNSEMRSWGREGERDYCISANNQTCLNDFASTIKNKFKGNKRIFVTENGTCKPKRN